MVLTWCSVDFDVVLGCSYRINMPVTTNLRMLILASDIVSKAKNMHRLTNVVVLVYHSIEQKVYSGIWTIAVLYHFCHLFSDSFVVWVLPLLWYCMMLQHSLLLYVAENLPTLLMPVLNLFSHFETCILFMCTSQYWTAILQYIFSQCVW